jgi:hypothetical protein
MLCFMLTYLCLLYFIPQQGAFHEEMAGCVAKVKNQISLTQLKGRFLWTDPATLALLSLDV